MTEPLEIFQDHLDRASAALWNCDVEAVLGMFTFPNLVATADGEMVHETEDSMRHTVKDYRAFLERSGARECHRLALNAAFLPQDTARIKGESVTYLLRGGQYVLDPFVTERLLVLDGSDWRCSESRSRVRNATCTILSPATLLARARDKAADRQGAAFPMGG